MPSTERAGSAKQRELTLIERQSAREQEQPVAPSLGSIAEQSALDRGDGTHEASGQQSLVRLSVIVPAYNEQASVSHLLARVRSSALPDGAEREIIVVDDGSTD